MVADLKTIQPNDLDCEPSDWNYCKREVEAYQSGWLDDLPAGLAAPACYGVIEHPDGTCWIWLEDLKDTIGANWPLEHYGIVARHVGQFNGAYLCGKPLPDWPWLSSGWLRGYIAQSAPWIGPLREMLDHSQDYPLLRLWFPGDAGDQFFTLWEDRGLFFEALDHLPQTLCHLDLFRRNLFAGKTADGEDQTVAIDWAYAGRGAIGEELVPLVQASIGFFEVDLAQAPAFEEIVLDGYLAGLGDAGWRGDPRQVQLGYTAGSIRYRLCEIWRGLEIIQDKALQGGIEQMIGCPIDEVFDGWSQVGLFGDSRTYQARELMGVLELVPAAAS